MKVLNRYTGIGVATGAVGAGCLVLAPAAAPGVVGGVAMPLVVSSWTVLGYVLTGAGIALVGFGFIKGLLKD